MPKMAVMTDSRWQKVAVGLLFLLLSYRIPSFQLPSAHIATRHRENLSHLRFNPTQLANFKTHQFFVGDSAEIAQSLFKKNSVFEVSHSLRGSGFEWAEGPTYMPDGNFYFSDVIRNAIYKWSPWSGINLVLNNSGDARDPQMGEPGSNGLLSDPKNPNVIFVAQHGSRRIVKRNLETNKVTVIANKFNGKDLNCPNDMALDATGEWLYFTDPVYCLVRVGEVGTTKGLERALKESDLGFQGIYRVRTDGSPDSIELLNDKLTCPNGIAFSPDFKNLYVSDSYIGQGEKSSFKIHKFPVDASGKLGHGKIWNEKSVGFKQDLSKMIGAVDGFAFHPKGYLVTSCPGGQLCVLSEDGQLKFVLKLSDSIFVTNVAFGGGRMFVTSGNAVFSLYTT